MPTFLSKLLIVFSLLLPNWASAADTDISVSDAFVRAPLPGVPNTSAYMTIHNHTDAPMVLVGGSSPYAKRVELHAHTQEDGVMKMRKLDEMVVKSQHPLYLLPGGLHLMLFDIDPSLADQQAIDITLDFSNGESVTLSAKVKSVMQDHSHH